MPERWAQLEPQMDPPSSEEDLALAAEAHKSTPRQHSVKFEDEESERYEDDTRSPDQIRQEALMMLEVCDDQLSSSAYSVHRTVTGGYSASHRSLGSQKRVPTALSGLSFAAAGKTKRASYFDNVNDMAQPSNYARDDYEYGDEDLVDVIAMENRSSASRPATESKSSSTSNNWSSRYSVDNTLLALSGGSVSSSKFLDKLDKEHSRERASARNLFASSPHETRDAQIFGSGFSFRQKYVFGKQNVTVGQPNLQSVYIDERSSLPPASPRKSWQDQVARKRRERRWFAMLVGALLVIAITVASVLGMRKRQAIWNSQAGPIPEGAVAFYVTSDVPYTEADEEKMVHDLEVLKNSDSETKFLVHLGNIQKASVTLCQPSRYHDVALMLSNSPVPTFVLPGEEDWVNCADQNRAWKAWVSSFFMFDKQYSYDFEVARQIDRMENFAFVESGVLFIGVHVVGGRRYSDSEIVQRNAMNLEWILNMAEDFADEARAIVVFGNARPGLPQNEDFFQQAVSYLQETGLPSLYVHANSGRGDGIQEYQPFVGASRVMALQVDQGGDNPPTRIVVGDGARPFLIS